MSDLRVAVEGILWVVGLFMMWRVVFRHRSWTRDQTTEHRPRISAIVPARNEGHQIRRLLRSLQEQTVQPYEVIVIDDDSLDDTGVVAHQEGATVMAGGPLPEGWNGKTWACWQGARAGSGEMLLFLDADTWLEPQGVERLLSLYPGRGLLTVQPYHVTEQPYEQLSAFFNAIVVATVGAFTPLGERLKPGGGFGPCVLCSRDEYLNTGGHRQVRGQVLEDIPLARLFLRHNLPVRCHMGQGIVSFRMYPGGVRELVEGWSKGMGYGAVSVHPAFSIMAAAWITGCFGALFTPIRAMAASGAPTAWMGWIIYLAYAFLMRRILQGIGRFKWWTWALFPMPLIFFAAVMLRSLLLTFLLGRVTWKGRAVNTLRRRG